MVTFSRVCSCLCILAIAALPVGAQQSASGYDRMEGDVIRPNVREVPKRNFNLSGKKRVGTEAVRSSANSRSGTAATYQPVGGSAAQDDRFESRTAKDRNKADRFRQPSDATAAAPRKNEVEEKPKAKDVAVSTQEATDVEEPVASSPKPFNENQLVYCSKRLLEFHWDPKCAMLKNVEPTRLTYKVAREARYAECTACGAANRR